LKVSVLRFGPFEFDTTSGELHRGDERIRLRPQPAAVLACLAGRAGELVSREELHRIVWGDQVHVNYDQGLNSCIKQVRRALGETCATTYLETLPRRGYRFLVPVEVLPGDWAAHLSDRIAEFFVQDVASIGAGDLRRAAKDPDAWSRIQAAAHHAVTAALAQRGAEADGTEPEGSDPFSSRNGRELR
jgi:DNA-binding winged helix-turn-helix (wHTH) protein